MKILLPGVGLLVVAWAAATIAISAADRQKMTPEKVIALAERTDVGSMTAEQQMRFAENLSDGMLALSFEQRRQVHASRALDEVFHQFDEAAKRRYIERTLPRGFEEMMRALNEMDGAEREALVQEALNDLDRAERDLRARGDARPRLSEEDFNRIVDEGMRSYFRDASAETKIDLQPVIERMQEIIQSPKHRAFYR